MLLRFLALASALSCAGCSVLATGEAGYARALAKSPAEDAVAVNANLGFGDGNVGGGGMVRMKFGANIQQVAIGSMMWGALEIGPAKHSESVILYGMGGAQLYQFESIHQTFAFGSFSPLGEIGVGVRPRPDHASMLTFAFAGEYDLRFSEMPNTGYASFLIGVGALNLQHVSYLTFD